MAKKRTVFVDVVVDDKGTTKKLAIDSKRLSDGLEKGSKGTKDFDRNLRGVIGTAQAGGRNFAALAQGIAGGIVPVYAAFAAQVFAIGAAFRFLTSAGDLATLEKGQIAYASSTGIALKTLTNRIQEATAGQVAFQDAAQAAAIGTAAGLSGDQLERLGGAAKDASIILGRDVTDSFNRLVRGVTKAEPELLDELGIILRLKDATETYAASLGKSANDLTQFEKSQAVANDVLTQAEKKYGEIIDIVDPSINQFNAFNKAFDDIVNSIKKGLDALLGPIAGILAKNPFATLLLAAPLLNGFIKVLLPGFDGLGNSIGNVFDKISAGTEALKKNAKVELTSIQLLAGDAQAASEFIKLTNEDLIDLAESSNTGFLGLKKLQGGGELAGRTIAKNLNDARNATGAFAAMPTQVRLAYIKMFQDLQLASKVTNSKMKADFAESTSFIKLKFQEAKLAVIDFMNTSVDKVKNGVRKIIANFARIASGIGIAVTLFQFLPKSIQEFFETISEPALRKFKDELVSLNEETSKFLEVQTKLNEDFEGTNKVLPEVAKNFTQLVGQISNQKDFETLEDLFKAISERGRFTQSAGELADVNELITAQVERFTLLRDTIDATNLQFADPSVKEYRTQIVALLKNLQDAQENKDVVVDRGAYLRAKSNVQDFGNTVKDVLTRNKTLQEEFNKSFSGLVAKGPYSEISANLNAQIKNYEKLGIVAEDTESTALAFTQKRVKQHMRLNDLYNEEILRLNKIKVAEMALDVFAKRQAVGATARQRASITRAVQEQKIQSEQEAILANIEFTIAAIAENNQPVTKDQMIQLSLLKAQADQLKENLQTLKDQRDLGVQINQSIFQGLESGLDANLFDLIIGKENDLKESARKIAESVFNSVGQVLSGSLTDEIMGLFGQKSKEQEIKDLYNGPEGVFTVGAGSFQAVMDDFKTQIQAKQAEFFGDDNVGKGVDGKGATVSDTFAVAANKVEAAATTINDTIKKVTTSAGNALRTSIQNAGDIGKAIRGAVLSAIGMGETEPEEKTTTSGLRTRAQNQGKKGLAAKIVPKGTTTVTETAEKIQKDAAKTTAEAAEKQEFSTITFDNAVNNFSKYAGLLSGSTGALGANVVGSLVTDIAGAFFGGLFGSSGDGDRYGSRPKGMALGGIARGPQAGYPAVLHGTEAVIPMPSGSIPVEMKGSGGGVNNVSVNVNMGDGTTNVQGGEQGAGDLGKVLARAVQEELQKQKRPGGILSPHGSA